MIISFGDLPSEATILLTSFGLFFRKREWISGQTLVRELKFNLLDRFFKPEMKAFGGGLCPRIDANGPIAEFSTTSGDAKRHQTIESFLPNFFSQDR